ncbi:hypothetical protein KFE25_012981 [Diacronema lutheri]|uniref:Prefoldin subunit 1 n=1 Tax=Diacronema lutheri TaxID=2081491 RepID=A0A8J5XA27_DIALT|nr:hypothetical protein KFE25_012981 [Diacronema lutheri]
MDQAEYATFQELQSNVTNVMRDLQLAGGRLNGRTREKQLGEITLKGLNELPAETRVHTQLGKAFLTQPLADVKASLQARTEEASREAAALAEKKAHLEAKVKQAEQEAQEFFQAHVKTVDPAAAASGS